MNNVNNQSQFEKRRNSDNWTILHRTAIFRTLILRILTQKKDKELNKEMYLYFVDYLQAFHSVNWLLF